MRTLSPYVSLTFFERVSDALAERALEVGELDDGDERGRPGPWTGESPTGTFHTVLSSSSGFSLFVFFGCAARSSCSASTSRRRPCRACVPAGDRRLALRELLVDDLLELVERLRARELDAVDAERAACRWRRPVLPTAMSSSTFVGPGVRVEACLELGLVLDARLLGPLLVVLGAERRWFLNAVSWNFQNASLPSEHEDAPAPLRPRAWRSGGTAAACSSRRCGPCPGRRSPSSARASARRASRTGTGSR